MHCFIFIGHISVDKAKVQMNIMAESFKHWFWVIGGHVTVAVMPVSEATGVTGV